MNTYKVITGNISGCFTKIGTLEMKRKGDTLTDEQLKTAGVDAADWMECQIIEAVPVLQSQEGTGVPSEPIPANLNGEPLTVFLQGDGSALVDDVHHEGE